MIELININKQFKEKDKVITAAKNVNLTINEEEIIGIIGYSGAGKSTLLRMMNLLIIPDSGSIVVDGINLAKISKQELRGIRQKMAMVFQSFNLMWSKTALNNITFALDVCNYQEDKIKRGQELLELVGLKGKENAYPSKLSGGEKQRVAIARALACNPKYLLCDEITSALDPETTQSILELLKKINKELKVTIILITHQMSVVQKIASKVIVMKEGEVVEMGNIIEILSTPKHEVTKKFLKEIIDPLHDLESIPNNTYRLNYLEKITNKTLISDIIKKFDVNITFLEGKIAKTSHGSLNSIFVIIEGANQQKAINYLEENDVKVVRINVKSSGLE